MAIRCSMSARAIAERVRDGYSGYADKDGLLSTLAALETNVLEAVE